MVDIELTEELRVGEYKTSQLFVARVVKSSQSINIPTDCDLVAKFYDPLYDDLSQAPFANTGHGYAYETAAYTRLADLQGSVIPRYYGSFTLKFRVGRRSRIVRLILSERIHGMPMDDLDPRAPREERQKILKQIVDAECTFYNRNVIHEDLYPRNILIKYEGDQKTPKVVIVDFGWLIFGRTCNPENTEEEQRHLPGTPISPLLRWNIAVNRQYTFDEWIDWPWQPWLEEQYKDTVASIRRSKESSFRLMIGC